MTIRRYARANILGANKQYGTSRAIRAIRSGIESGTIRYTTQRSQEGQRLDSIAGMVYGNGSLWWVIAAASDIGWSLQMPPETVLRIPNLTDISTIIG